MKTVVAWLDIETTGLDPLQHEILELSIVLREHNLNGDFITSMTSIFYPLYPVESWDDFIDNMHTESGLKKDIQERMLYKTDTPYWTASKQDVYFAEWIRNFKKNYDVDKIHLAGSSIHFDKGFLQKWMPEFFAEFHHRMIDISSLKLMFESVGIEIIAKEIEPKHRAWTDVQSSFNWYWEAQQWLMLKR